MRLFVCFRSIDQESGNKVISDLIKFSENSVAILNETLHSENWKENVEKKMQESDFVIFFIGRDTFTSKQIRWEYAKAKFLNKQIIGIKINNATNESPLSCQGFQVFENVEQSLKFLNNVYLTNRQLKIEQYKIMVSSTEKVTEQRLKVNNLFFTITSTIISLALILGKSYGFKTISVLGMSFLTLLALTTTYFWEKLITSYGKLNTGKFRIIDRIEKELRTNMFDEEWKILTQEIKYEPNSKTEVKIIERFRIFIIIFFCIELLFLMYKCILFIQNIICS
jgi:hypothetical protein